MTEQALQQYLIKQYPKEDEGSPSMEQQGRAASGNQIRHCTYIAKDCGADGNGRTCRLLMNLLQWEYDVLPTKVIKEDKAEYIQALIDTRESENLNVFLNCMTRHHCQHLQTDIYQFIKSTNEKVVDKQDLKQKMVDKALFGRENGRYFGIRGR